MLLRILAKGYEQYTISKRNGSRSLFQFHNRMEREGGGGRGDLKSYLIEDEADAIL